jgi:hypothetical protein
VSFFDCGFDYGRALSTRTIRYGNGEWWLRQPDGPTLWFPTLEDTITAATELWRLWLASNACSLLTQV